MSGDFASPISLRPKNTKIEKGEALSRKGQLYSEAGLNISRLGYCKGVSTSNVDGSYTNIDRCTKYNDLNNEPRKLQKKAQQPYTETAIKIKRKGYNIFTHGL